MDNCIWKVDAYLFQVEEICISELEQLE